MNTGVLSFSILALLSAPLAAWADTNPDFDDDAKPILNAQPGLVHYVEARFEVKDTGTAKYPGDDDRRPVPPYIFRARPLGSHGPYNLRLLIQPGPPGHILGAVDITKARINEPGAPATPPPAYASQPPPSRAPAPTYQSPSLSQPPPTPPATSSPAPAPTPAPSSETPSGPTSDTPSGPIQDTGGSSSDQPNLTPPPDPAPAAH